MARRETRGSCSPISPSKRLKILAPSSSTDDPWKKDDGDSDDCCGICLSSDLGKASRGEIDSCKHHFCFLCIMEWAKVETKCPMCKQRFSSIRRPPKDGVFSTERIVTVPPRNQGYDSSGVRTLDPYAETRCSVCNGMEDECFLLLCDLCDSAAHTFCVGLGHTVPSGDWFCHDCTVMKEEAQANVEEESDGGNQRSEIPAGETHVSVSTIVRECNCRATRMPPTLITARDIVSDREVEETHPRNAIDANRAAAPNSFARTRHRCRDVQNRIQTLRKNWDSLRHGSSNFAYASSSSGHDKSGNPSSSCSKSDLPSVDKVSMDVEKAWKMLDIAKYRQKCCSSTSSVHRAAQSKASGGVALTQHPRQLMRQPDTRREGGLTIPLQSKHDFVGKKEGNIQSSAIVGNRSKDKCIIKRTQQSREGIIAEYSSSGFSSLCSNGQEVRSLDCRTIQTSVNVITNKQELPGCTISVATVGQGLSCSFTARPGPSSSSATPKEECKASARGPAAEGAKAEIQSLVKLNLKLLTTSKRLGVDVYKGIARAATHTILAACGLDHTESLVHDFASPTCPHTDHIKQFHESTLMSSCCRECCYAFVRNVVDSIMQEKVSCAR